MADQKICAIVEKLFDLRPAVIIHRLKLKRPVYRQTARNGHFGLDNKDYTWEKLDMVSALRKAAKV
jgi:S-adenosylmethionine synthetase